MLEKGVKAPDFTLLNQEGEPVSLSGFLGKKVVLYLTTLSLHKLFKNHV